MVHLDTLVLLAAGLGTRMKNIISYPKTMIMVQNQTVIERLFGSFKEYGIKNLIIVTHYKADILEEHATLLNRKYQFNLTFIREDSLRETGGSLVSVLPLIKQDEFFTCNADMFMKATNVNPLEQLSLNWHAPMKQLMLMVDKSNSFGHDGLGDFSISGNGQLSIAPIKFIYTGLSIASKKLFANYLDKQKFSLSEIWFDNVANDLLKDIYGVKFDGRWFHIGDPETMDKINKVGFKI